MSLACYQRKKREFQRSNSEKEEGDAEDAEMDENKDKNEDKIIEKSQSAAWLPLP